MEKIQRRLDIDSYKGESLQYRPSSTQTYKMKHAITGKYNKKSNFIFILITLFFPYLLNAQKSDSLSDLLQFSLEKLMNIQIYSATKAWESAFNAPFSSSVVTRDEIKKAGCTSLMEALRLVPGVIVREQSNGNYDIHVRGLDNVPPNSSLLFFANSTTLVMIDNRPVYNYLHGSTFWETLPVDLNDIDRIEVVRGPSASIYGPNAVSGVINIITNKPENEGLYTVANAQYGSYNTLIANTSVGYKFNDKISTVFSANFQNRDRTQTTYYDVTTNEFVPIDSVTAIKNAADPNVDERYPHPGLAMRKYGFNAFLDYKVNEKIALSLKLGGQNSEVQNKFSSDYLTTATAQTQYADLKAEAYGFTMQLSHLYGTQAPNVGVLQWQWDLNTTDVVLEYKFDKIKNLNITPGISHRNATYDDTKYVNEAIKEGFWNGKVSALTNAAFLRGDYYLFNNKLRLIAAGRLDVFNVPSQPYFSYQLGATYRINEKNLLRVVQSRANRSPLIIDTHINTTIEVPGLSALIAGNMNLKLLTSDMLEIGYRFKLNQRLEVDMEVFGTRTKNFSAVLVEYYYYDTTSAKLLILIDFQNIPLTTQQIGGSISANCVIGKFHLKPFVSIQYTSLFDYSPYATSPNAPPSPYIKDPTIYNTNSGLGTEIKHVGTPAVYGGAYMNWQLSSKFNINLNPYFLSSYTQLSSSNTTYNDGERGVEKAGNKLLLNASVSYIIAKKLTVFGNFRNCLNDTSREFYKADATAFMALAGVHFEF